MEIRKTKKKKRLLDTKNMGGKSLNEEMMQMKNLGDLNNHLFEQLNRLNADDLKGEKLDEEIKRAKAVSDISKQIIQTGRLILDAEKFKDDKWNAEAELPELLSDGNE